MDSTKFEALFPADTRQIEIEKLLEYTKEGNFSQVIGLPGVGRSNLVGLLAYNRQLRELHLGKEELFYHFVAVNFTEIRGKGAAEALRLMHLSLIDSLRERGKTDIADELVLLAKEQKDDELALFHSLKQAVSYVVYKKKLKLIFLFDHFEEFAGTAGEHFFPHLAALQEHARYYFVAVFFLHRPLEQIVDPEMLSDVYRLFTGREVYLHIHDQVLDTFLINYLEERLQKPLSNEEKAILLDSTGGHAKLLKTGVEEWFREGGKTSLAEFLEENHAIRSICYEIWSAFHQKEQSLLRKLAVGENYVDTGDDKEITYLKKVGLVEDFTITIPLFASFVTYRVAHGLDEKIAYDVSTNKISKGGVVLNEVLTANEFVLLRFLVDHPEEVIDRDALVQAVWGDLKSQAGVTDQAIDQLLFRLRQKVESDPKNPRHIYTHKGRGVKFSP